MGQVLHGSARTTHAIRGLCNLSSGNSDLGSGGLVLQRSRALAGSDAIPIMAIWSPIGNKFGAFGLAISSVSPVYWKLGCHSKGVKSAGNQTHDRGNHAG
jgi:hypothetical protein